MFDALSTRRPYKPALPLPKCFEMIEECRGKHFDPQVLDAFFARRDDIVALHIQYSDA
jgi:putative two-component system response regulator